jgi:hypothetical protein
MAKEETFLLSSDLGFGGEVTCSGGSNPGLGARGLEPFRNFRGRKKGLEPLVGGSSF